MSKVAVVTDSSCDLPSELCEQLGIQVVPLEIRFGDGKEVYRDREELSVETFWEKLRDPSNLPSTAAPSPGDFLRAFNSAAEAGADSVICINLSEKLSGTIQAARQAASTVEPDLAVRVIDSQALTVGLGIMCTEAAKLASQGTSLERVTDHVTGLIGRTRMYGALDTLDYLRRGGRVGGAQALLGNLLSIKPVLTLQNGEVHPASKQRTRAKAIGYLAEMVHAQPVDGVQISHVDCEKDVNDLLGRLSDVVDPATVTVAKAGPVLGTHSGPGLLAVSFIISS